MSDGMSGNGAKVWQRRVRTFRSVEQKRQIVEETFAFGASVALVAQRHDVNANQVFQWRRAYFCGELGDIGARTEAATALVKPPTLPSMQDLPAFAPVTIVDNAHVVANAPTSLKLSDSTLPEATAYHDHAQTSSPAPILSITLPNGAALKMEGNVEVGLAQSVIAALMRRNAAC